MRRGCTGAHKVALGISTWNPSLVDMFFQKLAALQDSQPNVWTIFEEQTNFADRMEHEDGFDPCNGMPGSNIRFRLIKYWVNLYLNKRSLFGGAGAKGRAFRGWR